MSSVSDVFYKSPYKFTAKQRFALHVLPPLISSSLKAILATCRAEVRNAPLYDEILRTHGRTLVAIWHDSLALAACHYRNSQGHTLTSYSFDGELAARMVCRFGMRAVRGSSSRGGSDALAGLVEAAKEEGVLGFTLDGPRGPRRVAKAGIAVLAARTGLPIIPHAFTAHSAWRMNSWDRLVVPKPFSALLSAYGNPIPPPADDSPESVEVTRLRVERALNRLHEEIEAH